MKQSTPLVVALLALALFTMSANQALWPALFQRAFIDGQLARDATLSIALSVPTLLGGPAFIGAALISEGSRSRQILLAIGLVICAAGTGAFFLPSDVVTVAAGRAGQTIGAFLAPIAIAMVADQVADRGRARAIGLLGLGTALANLFVPMATAARFALPDAVPLIAAGATLAAAAWLAFGLRDPRAAEPLAQGPQHWFGPALIFLAIGALLHQMAIGHLNTALYMRFGRMDIGLAALAAPLGALGVVLGIVIGGFLADAAEQRWRGARGYLCALAALAIAGALVVMREPPPPVLTFVAGLFGSLYFAPFYAALCQIASPRRRAIAAMVGGLAGATGRGLAQSLAPLLGVGVGAGTTGIVAMTAAALTGAAAFALAGFFLARVKMAEASEADVFT